MGIPYFYSLKSHNKEITIASLQALEKRLAPQTTAARSLREVEYNTHNQGSNTIYIHTPQ